MESEHREVARALRESYESAVSAERGTKLKIFFLALTVDVGTYQGDSTHVIELIANLRRLGYRVRWIARRSGIRKMWPDPYFHCVSKRPKPSSDLMRVLQLLSSIVRGAYYILRYAGRSDLIYSRDQFSFLLALLPSRLMKQPIVYEVNGIMSEERKMHGDYLLNRLYVRLLQQLDRIVFTNAVCVVCVSDVVRQFYCSRFPELQNKIEVVMNGVNTRLFHPLRPDDEIARLRKRLGFDEGDEIVAYAGNFSLWQDVESLIAAVPMVLEKNPAVKFMIVGQGPTHAACVKLAEDLGVSDRCAFLGRVPYASLVSYINVADVCVAPYKANTIGCSIKVFEYLACGKPVVCSDIPGIANRYDGGALKLVEPSNPKALAAALLDILGNFEARMAQREFGPKAVAEFSWSNTALKVADICEKSAATFRDCVSAE